LLTDRVAAVLEEYAAKGVFRSFDRTRSSFRMVWHHDRRFELRVDARKRALSFRAILPGVPVASEMYRELVQFVESRHGEDLPPHRRADRAKVQFRCTNRAGSVSLAAIIQDDDVEYATRRLVMMVHEIFLTFLVEGPYYEYLVEQLGLEEDRW